VYFFTAGADVQAHRSYIKGETPDRTPQGDPAFSKRATHNEERDLYEAMTPGEGARASIDADGPYWVVLDHSHCGLPNRLPESADPISVFLDLQVVRKHSPF
jgi:hypothetical protein